MRCLRRIRDAVLARAAGIGETGRVVLEAVAIAPPRVELWLLEALAGDAVESLDDCLASGMVVWRSDAVEFRHEFARLAIEESLDPHRRETLHRKALAALAAPPRGDPDEARLAHHAEAAGDMDAVLEHAPAAGARAAALSAHREAAAQYARALRFADAPAPGPRAELLERYAQCLSPDRPLPRRRRCAGGSARGVPGSRRPVQGGRDTLLALAAQDVPRERHRSRARRTPGRDRAGGVSLEPALGMAYANLAAIAMNAENPEETERWGRKAVELAERLDDREILAHALNSIGTMEFLLEGPAGRAHARAQHPDRP